MQQDLVLKAAFTWILFKTLIGIGVSAQPAVAQIVPDSSLGTENSIVTPDIFRNGSWIDEISGGAVRDSNLFHSFQDFNVNEGQRVYFANPAAIDRIFSRVTGQNASEIFGTLGVMGHADLVLINPNGIFFGPDSQLDIRGAFVATTSDSLRFDNGYTFSAINPEAPPLLTLNTSMGLASWLPPTKGTITNAGGNLAAGENFVLNGQILTLSGSLLAGDDLQLQATNTVQITDRLDQAFIAIAGRDLLIQGNETLTIAALSHPNSGLYASEDITLRSANTIAGDAHFHAGADFRVETLTARPGAWTSPNDPIIRASGNVSFDEYVGASLHILAGGSVTVPGIIVITGPDASGNALSPTTAPDLASVTLANGETVVVDGVSQPTVDIRAGTTVVAPTGVTGDLSGILGDAGSYDPTLGGTAAGIGARADIAVGAIVVPGGLVLLSNQYQPRTDLPGDIAVSEVITADLAGGGDVIIDSRGELVAEYINVSGEDASLNLGGPSGEITLLADGILEIPFSTAPFANGIDAFGLGTGDILLQSNTAINQAFGPLGVDNLSLIRSVNFGNVSSGTITLRAPSVLLGGTVVTVTEGSELGGNLRVEADRLEAFQGVLATDTFGPANSGNIAVVTDEIVLREISQIASFSNSGSGGGGGDVAVQTISLLGTAGGQIGSFAFGLGDAGNVVVNAEEIALSGFAPGELTGGTFSSAAIFSTAQPNAVGSSGIVDITTEGLALAAGATLSTSAFGNGDAGTINVAASESITIDGAVFVDFIDDTQPSAIASELFAGAIGRGGDINLMTPVLRITNGGSVSALSAGDGDAGAVNIIADERVILDGVATFAAEPAAGRGRISRIEVISAAESTGQAGQLAIATPDLQVINGARIEATTAGVGRAGDILLTIADQLTLAGDGSGIFASTAPGSSGNGGDIVVLPNQIAIRDGARVSVASAGTGAAGNLTMQGNSLLLEQGLISAETVSSTGGNILLDFEDAIVLQDGSRISTTAGTAFAGGDGGNIELTTTYLIATPNDNNDITANAFTGSGGRVIVTAEGIFGLTPRSRAELEQLLGTTNPRLLDPANLASSDITAISRTNPQLNGQVIIQSPTTDPNQDAIALPENIVDASRLIAQGCASGSIAAQEIGSFVVTGRGGLPADPAEVLRSNQLLLDWATAEPPAANSSATMAATSSAAETVAPRQVQEVQALALNPAGEVILLAAAEDTTAARDWQPVLTCAGEVEH